MNMLTKHFKKSDKSPTLPDRAIAPPPVNQQSERPISKEGSIQSSILKGRVIRGKYAFYFAEDLSDKLDTSVRYYKKKCKIPLVDRSSVIAAILDNPNLYTSKSLKKMTNKVVDHLASRLTGRIRK